MTNLNLYVLDLETTHLVPDSGQIVEVGVARVDLERWKVYPEYGRVVHCLLDDKERYSWVFQHTDLTPEEVEASPNTAWSVSNDLTWHFFMKGIFTSYYEGFDFKWLSEKWNICPNLTLDIKDMVEEDYGERLHAEEAYRIYCPGNPARLPDLKEDHRALSDAVMESYILLALCRKDGAYKRKIMDDLVRE